MNRYQRLCLVIGVAALALAALALAKHQPIAAAMAIIAGVGGQVPMFVYAGRAADTENHP
jgi:hypothetical protein